MSALFSPEDKTSHELKYPVSVSKTESVCRNCKNFEERTNFCRLNPPQMVEVEYTDKYTHKIQRSVASKFPTISMPELDYCVVGFKNKHVI